MKISRIDSIKIIKQDVDETGYLEAILNTIQ